MQAWKWVCALIISAASQVYPFVYHKAYATLICIKSKASKSKRLQTLWQGQKTKVGVSPACPFCPSFCCCYSLS